MRRNKLILSISFIIFSLNSIEANAYRFESPQRLKDLSENFVKTQVKSDDNSTVLIETNIADGQFEVAHCNTDIIPSLPANTSNDNIHAVELHCMDTHAWKIQVPIKVSILSPVIVAKHTIPPKTTISEDDLSFAQYDRNKLYDGYFTNINDIVGNESAYSLNAGAVINKRNIKQPIVVRNNQIVTLTAQKGAISVSMQGIAREDGALNSIIKVYNPTSKKIVDSIVTGPNQAQTVG